MVFPRYNRWFDTSSNKLRSYIIFQSLLNKIFIFLDYKFVFNINSIASNIFDSLLVWNWNIDVRSHRNRFCKLNFECHKYFESTTKPINFDYGYVNEDSILRVKMVFLYVSKPVYSIKSYLKEKRNQFSSNWIPNNSNFIFKTRKFNLFVSLELSKIHIIFCW